MRNERFDRQIRFFGNEGQENISKSRVVVVGVGGLGSHVAQQLAYIGVGQISLIDDEEIDPTNLNRLIGSRNDDPIPGTSKIDIGTRLVNGINPAIKVNGVKDSLVSEKALAEIVGATHVFGCLDSEGARLILNEWCAAYATPYFDLATDILPGAPPNYGGRICGAWDGNGCIACLGLLDVAEAQKELEGVEVRKDRDAIYGVNRAELNRSGPSVVSINGVIASLGMTEFLVAVTGLRKPNRLLYYHGQAGKVTVSQDTPKESCYYCLQIRGKGDSTDPRRYIREGIGTRLR